MLGSPDESGAQDLVLPQSIMMGYFWRNILAGRFDPPSAEELRAYYVAHEHSIQELTTEETTGLDRALEFLLNYQNADALREYTEDNIIFIPAEHVACEDAPGPLKKLRPRSVLINISKLHGDEDKQIAEYVQALGLSPLTPREKIKILSDPVLSESIKYISQGVVANTTHYEVGNTTLAGHGLSPARFSTLTSAVRNRTGRTLLRVLDIGGGTGRALHDAKMLDPDIETINLTCDEELMRYPVDRHILAQAERMPADLEETIDITISYSAFAFFVYQDLGLKALIRTLRPGGEASIRFDAHHNYFTHQDELARRYRVLYGRIKELEREGYLEADLLHPDSHSPFSVLYWNQRISIIKKMSLIGVEL